MSHIYDYIRKVKIAAIRYLKNISLLVASICIIATVIVIAHPAEKVKAATPSVGGGASDKKVQTEQAKKNYILRRFISYAPVSGFRN